MSSILLFILLYGSPQKAIFADGFESQRPDAWECDECQCKNTKEFAFSIPSCELPPTGACSSPDCECDDVSCFCPGSGCACGFACYDTDDGPCSQWVGYCWGEGDSK